MEAGWACKEQIQSNQAYRQVVACEIKHKTRIHATTICVVLTVIDIYVFVVEVMVMAVEAMILDQIR